MKLWAKIATGAAVGGVCLLGYRYFKNLKRADAEFVPVPTIRVHKLGLDGVTFKIDAVLKNPTAAAFTIKYPVINLLYNGTSLGSSQVINKDIPIKAFDQAEVKDMTITIPISGIFSSAFAMAKDMIAGKAVTLQVNTVSTIDLGWKQQAYNKSTDVTIQKAA